MERGPPCPQSTHSVLGFVRATRSCGQGCPRSVRAPLLNIGWEIAFSNHIDHLIGCLAGHVAPGRH